jgi:hypothetical protein
MNGINPVEDRERWRALVSTVMKVCIVRFEVFTAVIMNNAVSWDAMPCGSCKTDVSEERIASNIRVTIIGELGTTLAVTSSRSTLQSNK